MYQAGDVLTTALGTVVFHLAACDVAFAAFPLIRCRIFDGVRRIDNNIHEFRAGNASI